MRAWRFSSAMPGSVPSKGSARASLVGGHRLGDRDLDQLGAEVLGDRAGVALGLVAGVGGGHDDALQALGADGVGGDLGDQRGVDAAREADDDVGEAVLADVVAHAEGEGGVDLGVLVEAVGDRSGGGLGSRGQRHVADEHLGVELRRAGDGLALGRDDDALAVEDQLVLAADRVAEGEGDAVGLGALGDHRLAGGALAARVGRARRVDDQARAGGRLVGLGRPWTQMSSQIVRPTGTPATSTTRGSGPGSK